MTGAVYYPPADRCQWYGPGNATVSPDKVLWHTTETPGGWPGYGGGSMAPNLTYDPWVFAWRQHFPLNGTARALANGTGYSTNRVGPCQIEVSCYCDPAVLSRELARELDGKAPPGSIAHILDRFGSIEFPDNPDLHEAVQESLAAGKTRGLLPESSMRVLSIAAERHVSKLSQHAYDDMGAFAAFTQREWGVPVSTSVTFKPYPSSYGNNGVRLSSAAFRDYAGHCAHMHAPYNDHGDCGSMDVHRLLAAAGGSSQEEQDMTPEQDRLLREIFNRVSWTNTRTEIMDVRATNIDPVLRETYNRAEWNHEQLAVVQGLIESATEAATQAAKAAVVASDAARDLNKAILERLPTTKSD